MRVGLGSEEEWEDRDREAGRSGARSGCGDWGVGGGRAVWAGTCEREVPIRVPPEGKRGREASGVAAGDREHLAQFWEGFLRAGGRWKVQRSRASLRAGTGRGERGGSGRSCGKAGAGQPREEGEG